MASNWLLIQILTRHSDHHYKPDRRFPYYKTYGDAQAPQLPYGLALLCHAAMMPWSGRRVDDRAGACHGGGPTTPRLRNGRL